MFLEKINVLESLERKSGVNSNKFRPVARLFCVGGQIGQIWGPFMITRGLSCDCVEFGHFGGGQMTPLTPPWLRA